MVTPLVQCDVAVVDTHPLHVRFTLENPLDASVPVRVPRSLRPLGAFVKLKVTAAGDVVYETRLPKFAPKLDPADADAYVELEPGYGYSVVLEADVSLPAGEYRLEASYSNLEYRRYGEQRCSATATFRVPNLVD